MNDLKIVTDFLPPNPSGDILITTQDSAMVGSEQLSFGIEVELFGPEDPITLFLLSLKAWSSNEQAFIQGKLLQHLSEPDVILPQSPVTSVLATKYELKTSTELHQVASLTGHLPLAIVQCTSFLRLYPMPYSRYVAKFHAMLPDVRRRFFSHSPQGASYDNSVMTTWEISFVNLQNMLPAAAHLLVLFGFIDRTRNPEIFLETAVSHTSF